MAGQCPLVHAARHGRLSVVGYLLACDWVVPASENEAEGSQEIGREEAAQQAVVAAAAQGHESVVEYLLDMAEVIVDRPDTLIGETALTIAAANGSTATVSALLARGASPTAVNAKGLSALMLAAREGHWGTAERLLQGMLPIVPDLRINQQKIFIQYCGFRNPLHQYRQPPRRCGVPVRPARSCWTYCVNVCRLRRPYKPDRTVPR